MSIRACATAIHRKLVTRHHRVVTLVTSKMDQVEERIVEEVRKYNHLYNSSSKHYKDCEMANNSWREIAENTGLEVTECMKKWKNLRDKYVRLRKKLATRSGFTGRQKVPAFYHFLSWLDPHVKHRETETNFKETKMASIRSPESDTTEVDSLRESFVPPSPPNHVPASASVTSRVSRPKRKRNQQDEWILKKIAGLEERRLELQKKSLHRTDECSRFAQTVADLLRRVPEDRRPDIMYKVIGVILEGRQ
ncbi:uncharacterized protein LOC130913538 [Corythoichthys intestinalis]|uniref:uncharacterized protein LOC130913538 n=1 Tax=Corythoichthys intestinalis TaxID=161448 RepID=UPI0025A61DE8|nr:uncharacterized protein LOC130913538 [Corythoichthys intestinalis]